MEIKREKKEKKNFSTLSIGIVFQIPLLFRIAIKKRKKKGIKLDLFRIFKRVINFSWKRKCKGEMYPTKRIIEKIEKTRERKKF